MSGRPLEQDVQWMLRAVALAERARDLAPPNPHVGCVLVRDGALVAEGWTQPPGGPHAEAMALAAVADATGTTAYVTLEPCAHTGRTPPCADALVAAGVTRVVIGLRDPNPVAVGGLPRLRAAWVEVREGVCQPWVRAQLAAFLVSTVQARPHVTLKLAQTVDGSLVAPDGRWVTGPASRRAVHRLRARVDAVMVGSGTVLADDPGLDVRDAPLRRAQPRAVVLDARGRTPPDARIVRPGTIVVTAEAPPPDWCDALRRRGVEVETVGRAPMGGVDLPATLTMLWSRHEVQTVLAEPGETLAGALLDADVVDRIVRHVATSVQAADGTPRIVACAATTAGWPLRRWVRRQTDVEVVADRPG